MGVAASQPQSPCNRSCTLDPETNTCLGCYRTLEEIMGWSAYSAEHKRAVLERLPGRKRERALRMQERSKAK